MADSHNTPHVDMMRSPLGRARGYGAAQVGLGHWWAQRVTSVALVPLSLWFVCAVIRLEGASRADVAHWLAGPLPMVLMLVTLATLFYHLQLGISVIIEDYVHHEAMKVASGMLVKAVCLLLALVGMVSVLRLGLT